MNYKVKQEDLIGDIAEFPIEVVQAMVDEQVRQYKYDNVTVFQRSNRAGFNWHESKEGWGFWNDVIINKNFDLFFQRYTKQQELIPDVEGVMMEVGNDGVNWYEYLVLFKHKGLFYTEGGLRWNHARPIPEKNPHTFDLTDEQATKIKSMLERGEI